jgi:transcriptional regulator
MYAPPAFREDDPAEIIAIMQAARLPILVTMSTPVMGGELFATHLPLIHEPEPAPHGRLIGHVAKANPHWRNFDPAHQALAIFQAHDAYISPSWYATKQQTGRVVPTWNYQAVHAYGRIETIEDPVALHRIVSQLTDRHETGRDHPWQVTDAPADYIEAHMKGIVGIVMTIEKLIAKQKLSQNRSQADRAGVIAGLDEAGETDLARLMQDQAAQDRAAQD